MKKLLILSGKGGTGKTTVASAFIYQLNLKSYADCDVDAPNLHITAGININPQKSDFYGMPKAFVDIDKCCECKRCMEVCKFNAITFTDRINIDLFACEGCNVCKYVCSQDAIVMKETVSGETYIYDDEPVSGKVFSTARLKMGAGASGKLVTQVKKNMRVLKDNDIAVIDGSPGIGCPVIASMSGVHMVLIVTEPSISGISDLKRILKTAKQFRTKSIVCINKYDINLENTQKIQNFCEENNIQIVGKIPYDNMASKAINQGKSIIEIDCAAKDAVKEVINKTTDILLK